jgi:S1-C subfamily serine protease
MVSARIATIALVFSLAGSCALPRQVDATPVTAANYRYASERLTAVVVSEDASIRAWVGSRFSLEMAPEDAEGGSATPISADGYFITADHVLESLPGRKVWVIYGNAGRPMWARARVVWRSKSSDIAVLKADIATPRYYQWAAGEIPVGTPIMHAGIATGSRSKPGRLASEVRPDMPGRNYQTFKHDVPLQPGDSGGPVIDARNRLVGVNSAVEFLVPLETAFFIESEGTRPSLAFLRGLVERDRRQHGGNLY